VTFSITIRNAIFSIITFITEILIAECRCTKLSTVMPSCLAKCLTVEWDHAEYGYAECHYAKCHYPERRSALI